MQPRRQASSIYRAPPPGATAEARGGLRGDRAILAAVAATGIAPFVGAVLGDDVPAWQLGVGVLWVLGPLLALGSERGARSELDLHAHLDDAIGR